MKCIHITLYGWSHDVIVSNSARCTSLNINFNNNFCLKIFGQNLSTQFGKIWLFLKTPGALEKLNLLCFSCSQLRQVFPNKPLKKRDCTTRDRRRRRGTSVVGRSSSCIFASTVKGPLADALKKTSKNTALAETGSAVNINQSAEVSFRATDTVFEKNLKGADATSPKVDQIMVGPKTHLWLPNFLWTSSCPLELHLQWLRTAKPNELANN